jgi:hypothetical protein
MKKLKLNNIGRTFLGKDYIVLLGIGFDQRTFSVLDKIPSEKISEVIGISNMNTSNEENVRVFTKKTALSSRLIGGGSNSIVELADELSETLGVLGDTDREIIVDITAMSHEVLAVTLGVLNSLNKLPLVTILYVGADKYSFNEQEEDMWLSRGVASIRSILGYPGVMLPSHKMHLIMMIGFEVERASEVIKRYEPNSLSIGLGLKEESVSATHYENNKMFFEKVSDFVTNYEDYQGNVNRFEFSCVSPIKVKNELLEHIKEVNPFREKNVVICPLNSKLSTVGAILAAFERSDLQLCYAEPIEYNSSGYASPSDEVTLIEMKELL